MRRIPVGLRWLALSSLLAFIACSSGKPQEEGVSSTSEALSNTARVLSFEQPTTDRTASGLSLQQGNPHIDGQHSSALTITKNGGRLTSLPLTSLGPISSTVTLQVRLPSYVASTAWKAIPWLRGNQLLTSA